MANRPTTKTRGKQSQTRRRMSAHADLTSRLETGRTKTGRTLDEKDREKAQKEVDALARSLGLNQ